MSRIRWESGLAAAALPALPAGLLRGLLVALLRTSVDVDALAVDYFPEIKRRFSAGMERGQRESLLLEHAAPHALYQALRAMFGEKVRAPPRLSDGLNRQPIWPGCRPL